MARSDGAQFRNHSFVSFAPRMWRRRNANRSAVPLGVNEPRRREQWVYVKRCYSRHRCGTSPRRPPTHNIAVKAPELTLRRQFIDRSSARSFIARELSNGPLRQVATGPLPRKFWGLGRERARARVLTADTAMILGHTLGTPAQF